MVANCQPANAGGIFFLREDIIDAVINSQRKSVSRAGSASQRRSRLRLYAIITSQLRFKITNFGNLLSLCGGRDHVHARRQGRDEDHRVLPGHGDGHRADGHHHGRDDPDDREVRRLRLQFRDWIPHG